MFVFSRTNGPIILHSMSEEDFFVMMKLREYINTSVENGSMKLKTNLVQKWQEADSKINLVLPTLTNYQNLAHVSS